MRAAGEWNYGGFPWWINDVNAVAGNNSAYKAEMERWITALVEHIRPFLASNGGPVAMMQCVQPQAAPPIQPCPCLLAKNVVVCLRRCAVPCVVCLRRCAAARIENEFSDQSAAGIAYAEWAMTMAQGLRTGVPWTFCNNRSVCPHCSPNAQRPDTAARLAPPLLPPLA
eukprot:SAG11_NODE_9730_length_885_cov_0.979644_1_plen_168_part_01